MKHLLTISFLMAFSGVASASIESKAVDALVAAHPLSLPKIQLAALPNVIVCAKGSEQEIVLTDLRSVDSTSEDVFSPKMQLRTNEDQSGLIIDWSDGDQIGGLFLKMSDLKKLSAGNGVVPAKAYNGFWWMDGDHYEMNDVECSGSLNN